MTGDIREKANDAITSECNIFSKNHYYKIFHFKSILMIPLFYFNGSSELGMTYEFQH